MIRVSEPNATKLRSKALIGKGSRGGRGRKRDRREINSCQTQDFKIISPPAPSSPPAPPALKEFSAYLSAIRIRALCLDMSPIPVILVVYQNIKS